jgi:hypothetical protein
MKVGWDRCKECVSDDNLVSVSFSTAHGYFSIFRVLSAYKDFDDGGIVLCVDLNSLSCINKLVAKC